MSRKPRSKYSTEFKQQMVDLHLYGKPQSEICREYEIGASVLSRWIAESTNSGSFQAKDNRTSEENELIRLRKENQQLQMECDILKQAALIMARK